MGAVQYSRSGCPEVDVCTSRFEPLSYLLSPQGRRGFVRQLQGHSRRLWRLGSIVARVGRGTGDSSAAWSGVCRYLLAPYKVSLSSPKPPDQSGHVSFEGGLAFI
jgi:hypothetical protein